MAAIRHKIIGQSRKGGDVTMLKKVVKGFLVLAAISMAISVIARLVSQPSTPVSPADRARNERASEDSVTKSVGEATIQSMLKDPASAVFKSSEGRIKGGLHVACGYVNAKNSFGAMAGASPWLVIVETKVAMIATSDNAGKFNPLWNKYCASPADGEEPERNPPESFRGIAWGAVLPSTGKLRDSALKGCAAIVEQEDLTAKPPCGHMHFDNDTDMFVQRQNVPPLFDVPVSEQLLVWQKKKFWMGTIYIYNYKETDLANLRAALTNLYGEPPFKNEKGHLFKWTWSEKSLEISLNFDPVAKPGFGTDTTLRTSLSLSFGQIE